MPTIQEKEVAIAEMIGLLPLKKPHIGAVTNGENYKGRVFFDALGAESWYTFPEFSTDANWQYEAIEWIENQGYPVDICQEYCTISTNSQPTNEILSCTGSSKREAVFEALYQFSQYLKQKK